MTQLIASNQLTLTNVNDGQTAVVHWAYSDNADGTGFTTTDNGQRYIGHYSDYTQADSTDKTKYRWADRWAKIEVGTNNLLLQSSNMRNYHIQNISGGVASQVFSYDETDNSVVITATGQTTNRWWGVSWDLSINKIIKGEKFAIRLPIYRDTSVPAEKLVLNIKNHALNDIIFEYYLTTSKADAWEIHEIVFEATRDIAFDGYGFYIYVQKNGKMKIGIPTLVRGSIVPREWLPSLQEQQANIDSKADQALTQEQLNALNEKNQILETEMQAKASMDAFSEFEKAYQAFVKSNADSQAKSEADLIEAGRRIELLTTQFGGLSELKTFIDTYMSSSNEGLIIGKNDESSTIKVSSDRISMFSAGKEVMYISQGVININNGIFTTSVQIGKFRTEQYHLNADMNVIRYVGG